jgi:molybdenum-dependent DNA-binding transcriptional regulator ModE
MQDRKEIVNKEKRMLEDILAVRNSPYTQVIADIQMSTSILAVSETKSYTGAAKKLGCSKSLISKDISKAEELIGQKLFHRTTRKVSASNVGRRVVGLIHVHHESLLEALAAENLCDSPKEKVPSWVQELIADCSRQGVRTHIAAELKKLSTENAIFNQPTLFALTEFLRIEGYVSETQLGEVMQDLYYSAGSVMPEDISLLDIVGNTHEKVLASGLWSHSYRSRYIDQLIAVLNR